MNHQHTVLRTAQILTRDETAKKCRRGNIVVYWPTLYFFQYLFWLNFPVFFFKFSFLVFWQSSKKKKYDRKASAIFGLKEVARVLSALHNSLLPLCITMKTQTVLHTHRYSYWLFAWCWRTQKIQRFSSNNYTWPIHEWINVLEPKWKTVMFIYWTSIYFIHYM